MLRLRFTLFALFCLAVLQLSANYPKASHLLDTLDYYVANRAAFHTQACDDIMAKSSKIKRSARNCSQLPAYAEVVGKYMPVNADSALYYAESALNVCRQFGDSINLACFAAMRSHALTNRGDVYLATLAYENVDARHIPDRFKSDYFEIGYNIYMRAFLLVNRDDKRQNPYEVRLKASLDSLNAHPTADAGRTRYYNDIDVIHGNANNVDGVADLIDLLTYSTSGTYLYGKMANEIAHYYVKEGQNDLAKYYYTVAAISDIKGGFSNIEALHGLGTLLHSEGDIDRANKYLKVAIDYALLEGDHSAAMYVAQSLRTLFDDVNNEASKVHRSYIMTVVVAMILLVLILCMVIYFNNRRITFYKRNSSLRQSHTTKNVYIRKLLTMCALELNALEDYNRLVARKIKANQVVDLLRISESGHLVEEQLQTFQSEFDASFLAARPNFIERVNELMQHDKKYPPMPAGTLNTELRYLAFMSLGVDDYQDIAIFLGITQSSAYTYKNKLKNKAVDRENFEENIANLD
jgi:hypothetical protein